MPAWFDQWPTPRKSGYFWFYGWRFRSEYTVTKTPPMLYLVKVRAVQDGKHAYICGSAFMFKAEGAVGFWQRAVTPETPTEESAAKLLRSKDE